MQLAIMYDNGLDAAKIKKNEAMAKKWYEASANNGNLDAVILLSRLKPLDPLVQKPIQKKVTRLSFHSR